MNPVRWAARLGEDLAESLSEAMASLRGARLRSGLTVLGVVIGVATVMTMATIVQGLRSQILNAIEVAGPTTFYVLKIFSTTPLNPEALPKHVRIRPDLTPGEADEVRRLPEVRYAALWAQVLARVEYQGSRSQAVAVFGADERFQEIQGGELLEGRWFTRTELQGGANRVVLQETLSNTIFGRISPLGKTVLVGGRPAEVIGLYQPPDNIFQPPGSEIGAVVPQQMLEHQFRIDRTNALWIPVKPRDGVSVDDAMSAVRTALRARRGLRPGDPDTFDLVSQDQILDTFMTLTDTFFVVMLVLASVALMVGGIGVMAVMMVAVTDRTREIGIRKAVGATRRDIGLQFLVEAATLTGLGGLLGIVVGLGMGRVAAFAIGVEAETPVDLTIIAVVVSVGIGVVFGVLPARRAARMDPVEALRHE